MGKGTITGNLGEGLYTITVDSGQARADASILVLQIQLSDLDAQIAATTSEKNALDAEVASLQADYDAEIAAYVAAGPNAPTDALERALFALQFRVSGRNQKATELQRLQADRSSSARRLNELQALNLTQSVSAWCVDYTANATGEVATIEIPGEPSRPFLIAPGGRAPTAADGKLLAREVMTGPQAYFNAAILPGWQKFKPTYRRGVITAINIANDTADVTLYDDRSSADALVINQTSTLSNVPIVYQDCNADVFELGDDCVVEFQGQNWSNPKVIGFLNNPRVCSYFRFYYSTPTLSTDFYCATNNTSNLILALKTDLFAFPLEGYFSTTSSGEEWSNVAYELDFFTIPSTLINSNYSLNNNKYWICARAYENPPFSYTLRPYFKVRTELGSWSSNILTTEYPFAASTIAKNTSGTIVYIVIGVYTPLPPFYFFNSQKVGISTDGLNFSFANRLPNDAWKGATTRDSDNRICAVGSTYSAISDDGGLTWDYASFGPFEAKNFPVVRGSGSYFVQIESNGFGSLDEISTYTYSLDGLNWSNANLPTSIRTGYGCFASGKNNKFIIVPKYTTTQKFVLISKNPATGFEKLDFPAEIPDCILTSLQYNPINDDFIVGGYKSDETQEVTFAIKF